MFEKVTSTIKHLDVYDPCEFEFHTWIEGNRRNSSAIYTESGIEEPIPFEDLLIDFGLELSLELTICPAPRFEIEQRYVWAETVLIQTIENGGIICYFEGECPEQILIGAQDMALTIRVIE